MARQAVPISSRSQPAGCRQQHPSSRESCAWRFVRWWSTPPSTGHTACTAATTTRRFLAGCIAGDAGCWTRWGGATRTSPLPHGPRRMGWHPGIAHHASQYRAVEESTGQHSSAVDTEGMDIRASSRPLARPPSSLCVYPLWTLTALPAVQSTTNRSDATMPQASGTADPVEKPAFGAEHRTPAARLTG
jgi:hypothetical protein